MFGHLVTTRRDETSTFRTRHFFIAGPQGSDGVTRNFPHFGCGSEKNGRPAAGAVGSRPPCPLWTGHPGPAAAGLAFSGAAVGAQAKSPAAAAGEGRYGP